MDPDRHPLVRGMDPRIWICIWIRTKMSRSGTLSVIYRKIIFLGVNITTVFIVQDQQDPKMVQEYSTKKIQEKMVPLQDPGKVPWHYQGLFTTRFGNSSSTRSSSSPKKSWNIILQIPGIVILQYPGMVLWQKKFLDNIRDCSQQDSGTAPQQDPE